jgi:ferredoxin-NADP reductase
MLGCEHTHSPERNIAMSTITKAVTENPHIVTLTIGDPPFSSWTPGQFLRLSVRQGTEWSKAHNFTISSAPEEGEMRITVKAAGPFTSALQSIPSGTEVRIRGPLGHFCKNVEQYQRVTLIAGGIGITPFLSVLRHWARVETKPQFVLLWANNTTAEIIHREELNTIAEKLGARIVHILWKDEDSVKACACESPQTCQSGLLDAATLAENADLDHSEIFLCGPPQMHKMTKEILRTLGVDPARIHTEVMV